MWRIQGVTPSPDARPPPPSSSSSSSYSSSLLRRIKVNFRATVSVFPVSATQPPAAQRILPQHQCAAERSSLWHPILQSVLLSLAFLREKETQAKASRHWKNPLWRYLNNVDYTDKKEKKIFFIYKEIQMGLVATSSMRKGVLIHEEMRKNLVIYEEAVSHIWFCNRSRQNFLMYEENLILLFISVWWNRWMINSKDNWRILR